MLLFDETLAGGLSQQAQGSGGAAAAGVPQAQVQPEAQEPQQSAYLRRWDAFDQVQPQVGVQPGQQQAVPPQQPPEPQQHQQQQAVAHQPPAAQPQQPQQHRSQAQAQPSPGQPGSPGEGLPSPAVAAGFPQGVPEPELPVAPPAASTAVEALLMPLPGCSQEGGGAGGQTPARAWSTPRAAAGLRNPAAADALGDVQVRQGGRWESLPAACPLLNADACAHLPDLPRWMYMAARLPCWAR